MYAISQFLGNFATCASARPAVRMAPVEPLDRLDLFEISANGIVERLGFGRVKVVGTRAGIDALAPMQRPANAGSVPARRRN
jgi:hypothetical protein